MWRNRKFDHAGVIELIRSKVLFEIVERYRHRLQHALSVKVVRWVMENFHGDIVVLSTCHRVVGRLNRKESEDRVLALKANRASITLGGVRD